MMGGNDQNTYGFRKDDADALIASIGMGEVETPGRRLPGKGGGSSIIILTPAGGIPPRSGNTLGSAVCSVYLISDTNELVDTTTSVEVLNMTQGMVEGDVFGQAKRISGRWVIDVEECEVNEPASSSTAGP